MYARLDKLECGQEWEKYFIGFAGRVESQRNGYVKIRFSCGAFYSEVIAPEDSVTFFEEDPGTLEMSCSVDWTDYLDEDTNRE